MRELCGSRTDACSGISPGPLCPRNLQGGRTIQAHWSIKWNDDVGKLNVIWFPRHNNNNNNKSTIPTNWHRLVTYSGCVFVESQGVGGQLLSATGETIKEPLPADLTLTSWLSEEEHERFRFPRVTLMNVAWRQNDTHTAERHTVWFLRSLMKQLEGYYSSMRKRSISLQRTREQCITIRSGQT